MVHPKRNQLLTVAADDSGNKNSKMEYSKALMNSHLPGEDNWVIVKHQRITILIPPVPYSEQSAMHKDTPFEVLSVNRDDKPPPLPKPRKLYSVKSNDEAQVGSLQCFHQKDHHLRIGSKNAATGCELGLGITPNNPSNRLEPSNFGGSQRRLHGPISNVCFGLRKCQDQPWREPLGIVKTPQRVLTGVAFFGDRTRMVNRMMRAKNIERKLERAGGLKRWLASMGLEQFERILVQGKNEKQIGKFELANLSMKKLKDMGALAVGPRRKLIHAIECLCQPPCFQAF